MSAKVLSQVHQERIVLQDKIPLKTPLVIYVEPSGYCNLKCKFCPQYNARDTIKKDFMSVELFKKLIDDMSAFPDKIELLRVCGTGEPFMNKNIVEMLKYARRQNVVKRIELISNGVLLNDNLIENVPQFVDRIIISIEGLSAEDYKNVCNVNVDFQKLVNNLKALHANKRNCTIHLKIHHEAVPSEEKKAEFLNNFGKYCDEIYIEKLISLWPQFDSAFAVKEFRYGGAEVIKRQVCSQIFKGMQVMADGGVIPCCADWKGVNILGDINKASILEIWNGDKLKKLRIEHLKGNKGKTDPCKDCTMNDFCDYDNIDQYADECIRRLNT